MLGIKSKTSVVIRWMVRRELFDVLAIEAAGFAFPLTEEAMLSLLRQRNCIGMVAEHNEKVIGFMIYELHKAKLHVLNFAVHPDYRRQGVGRQVVAMLARKLSSHRRTRLTAVLADHNLAGHLFFRACGFRSVRVLRDYFTTPPADGYLMRYKIPSSARRSEP
jgi:[ribosomal protein S18]-alanine N-acetyltransferase